MSTRVMTLFGEEIIPEPQKPVAKVRGKKGEDTLAEQAEGSVAEAVQQPVQEEVTEVVAELVAEQAAMPELMPAEVIAAEEVAPIALPEAAIVAQVIPEPTLVAEQFEVVVPDTEMLQEAEELSGNEPAEQEIADTIAAAAVEEIIPEDWHGDKKYYTIGEVAGFFKVKTSHIRFWTNEFKLKVRTTRKGDRLFSPEQVKELRAIYHLVKERGFTLSGAKTKLKAQNKRDVTTVDLKTSLLQLKNRLVILRDQLV
jgi:DNA-binding transcriptional MerR regulator